MSHDHRNGSGALQNDEARDADEKVGVQLVTDSGTEAMFTVLTATFTKTHQVGQGWPTSTDRRNIIF
jgi:hypothetical protein